MSALWGNGRNTRRTWGETGARRTVEGSISWVPSTIPHRRQPCRQFHPCEALVPVLEDGSFGDSTGEGVSKCCRTRGIPVQGREACPVCPAGQEEGQASPSVGRVGEADSRESPALGQQLQVGPVQCWGKPG